MKRILLLTLATLVAALCFIVWLGLRENDSDTATGTAPVPSAELLATGAYLTRAGNCMACHTARGGAPYAGGRTIQTPFGAIPSSNITPDRDTGIGSWSADDFWRALHHGKSKDGTLLYPAFPFPNYSKVTRADADAMYAYLRSIAPVRQRNREPDLRFPFNQRLLLIGWRALYFRPAVYQPQQVRSKEWNRGAYLVQGLGHCSACHAPRNALGATRGVAELGGAMIPMLNWYAASLTGGNDAGPADHEVQQLADLLKTGVSLRGAVSGPMAEVVRDSLQHLTDSDIRAIAVHLQSLPPGAQAETALQVPAVTADNQAILKRGAALYETHCVDCHQAGGEGAPPHFPRLAGNHALLLASPANPVRAVLHGGYPPSTAGNPRPFGMPPFGNTLSDDDSAALLSYIRNAWGNRAPMVSAAQVNRYRAVSLD